MSDYIKKSVFLPPISQAEVAQLVEHNLAKVGVASSSLVFRSSVETFPETSLRVFKPFPIESKAVLSYSKSKKYFKHFDIQKTLLILQFHCGYLKISAITLINLVCYRTIHQTTIHHLARRIAISRSEKGCMSLNLKWSSLATIRSRG